MEMRSLAKELSENAYPGRGIVVVAFAVADLAVHIHVGQEVHLDGAHASTFAVLASPSAHIERETPGLVAAYAGAGQLGEEGSDLIEDTDIGGRIAARGTADGSLVYLDDFVDMFDSEDRFIGQGLFLSVEEMLVENRVESLIYKA